MRLLRPLLCSPPSSLFAPLGAAAQETPVVLELFTSQGCSSCPPADALLTELAGQRRGDRAGAARRLLGLSRLEGRLRPPGNTARQRAYAKAARSRSIFTPEMIVQGDERLKGHDAERILTEIAAPAGSGRRAPRLEPGARGRRAGDPPRAHRRRAGRPGRRASGALPAVGGGGDRRRARTPGARSPIPTSSPTGRRSGAGTAPRRSTCATRGSGTGRWR